MRQIVSPLESLHLFEARADEMVQEPFIKSKFSSEFTFEFDAFKGVHATSSEPNPQALRSFLLSFRQFISKGEPVFLGRIYGICFRCLTSATLKDYLVKSREAWKQALKTDGIKLVIRGQQFTPEYVTDLWINGYYFHNDIEKRAALERLFPFEQMLVRNKFLNYVVDATQQMIYTRNIVKAALRDGSLDLSKLSLRPGE